VERPFFTVCISKMLPERFYILLSRRFAGEASVQEQEELEQLLRLHPEWRELIAQYPQHRQADTEAGRLEAEAAFAAHAVKMQLSGLAASTTPLSAVLPEKQSRRPLKTGLLLAASLILLACSIIYLDKKMGKPLPARAATVTPIVLSQSTLKDITDVLARRFNVSFVFKSEAVQQYTYSGTYGQESLEEILAALSRDKKFSYMKIDNEVTINQ
jgi:hypothetical protein